MTPTGLGVHYVAPTDNCNLSCRMFALHQEGGENLAALLTLCATGQFHGANPEARLADVLMQTWVRRVSMDERMPWNWEKGGFVVPELRMSA
jgi:hypothetical protein